MWTRREVCSRFAIWPLQKFESCGGETRSLRYQAFRRSVFDKRASVPAVRVSFAQRLLLDQVS